MQDIKVVIGGNFGDEGKGLMTDYFAADAAKAGRRVLVVCSNGGAQRGHTVVTPEGVRHVFHHFGSGTFAGADTWLPGYFIVNPMIFMQEYEALTEAGAFSKTGRRVGKGAREGREKYRIFMDPECPVSTPFDMITNQILEEHRGAGRHGSCGVGIWETLIRDGLRLGELCGMTDEAIRDCLYGECRDYMRRRLAAAGIREIPADWKDILEDEGLVENYIADFRRMCAIAELREIGILQEYDRIIFENGQGLLLDRSRKEYGCHTTPSNTGLRNPAALIREYVRLLRNMDQMKLLSNNFARGPEHRQGKQSWDDNIHAGIIDVEVCYVTRTYLTRHGAGRFDEECEKAEINASMVDRTNVPNPHQGTLRYGRLDEKAFLRRIREDYDSERLPEGCVKRITVAVTHANEYAAPLLRRGYYISDRETRDSVKERAGGHLRKYA